MKSKIRLEEINKNAIRENLIIKKFAKLKIIKYRFPELIKT